MLMKKLTSVVISMLLITGCVSESTIIEHDHYNIETAHQAQVAYSRVRMLVIHYTAEDFDRALAIAEALVEKYDRES